MDQEFGQWFFLKGVRYLAYGAKIQKQNHLNKRFISRRKIVPNALTVLIDVATMPSILARIIPLIERIASTVESV